MTKPATPITMWAAVRIASSPGRRDWIHYHTVARTRAEARKLYCAMWDEEYQRRALAEVRFQRVVVSLEG